MLDILFDGRGVAMGLVERHGARHADVHFDGVVVAYAARAEVVESAHARFLADEARDLLLHLVGQAGLQQVADRLANEPHGLPDDEATHGHGRQGVEDGPLVAQEDGAADTHARAHGGEGVGTMVPGIGHDYRRLIASAHTDREAVAPLLGDHAQQGGHEGYPPGLRQHHAMERVPDLAHAFHTDHHAHGQQHAADQGRGEGLILAVAKVVALVLRLIAQPDEDQHDKVGHEVAQRMDGIGYHSRRTAQHACHKLEDQQHAIDHAAAYRHAVNGLLPLPVIFLFYLFLIPLFHLFPSFLLIPHFHHSLLIYRVFIGP